MQSIIKILVLALIFLPLVGFAYMNWLNHSDFKFLCEKVAVAEGRLNELHLQSNLDGGDFNEFERQLYKRVMNNEFELHGDEEVASGAGRLAKRTRLFYVCFAVYVIAFAIFFLPRV